MALDGVLKELRQAQQQAAKVSSRRQAHLRALQEKLKAGESTGNPITDRVILQFQGSQEAEEKIQGLYHSLKENENGLVAVEEAYEYSFGEQGCFGGRSSMYFVALQMGRIREPFLKMKEINDDAWWMFTDAEIAAEPRICSYVQSNVFRAKNFFPVQKKPAFSTRKKKPTAGRAAKPGAPLGISLGACLGLPLGEYLIIERIGQLQGRAWHGMNDHDSYRLHTYKIYVGTAAVDERFKDVNFVLHGNDGVRSPKDYVNKDFYAEMCKLLLAEDR